jgi:hypothetical protein
MQLVAACVDSILPRAAFLCCHAQEHGTKPPLVNEESKVSNCRAQMI